MGLEPTAPSGVLQLGLLSTEHGSPFTAFSRTVWGSATLAISLRQPCDCRLSHTTRRSGRVSPDTPKGGRHEWRPPKGGGGRLTHVLSRHLALCTGPNSLPAVFAVAPEAVIPLMLSPGPPTAVSPRLAVHCPLLHHLSVGYLSPQPLGRRLRRLNLTTRRHLTSARRHRGGHRLGLALGHSIPDFHRRFRPAYAV